MDVDKTKWWLKLMTFLKVERWMYRGNLIKESIDPNCRSVQFNKRNSNWRWALNGWIHFMGQASCNRVLHLPRYSQLDSSYCELQKKNEVSFFSCLTESRLLMVSSQPTSVLLGGGGGVKKNPAFLTWDVTCFEDGVFGKWLLRLISSSYSFFFVLCGFLYRFVSVIFNFKVLTVQGLNDRYSVSVYTIVRLSQFNMFEVAAATTTTLE